MSKAIRQHYDNLGVEGYYKQESESYNNPHNEFALACFNDIWQKKLNNIITSSKNYKICDFACGDGLITKELLKKEAFRNLSLNIVGNDKFMRERYQRETKMLCHEHSFNDVAEGRSQIGEVDLMVISYAIDLVEKSYLQKFLYQVALTTKNLLIIRPNKHLLESPYWNLEYQNKIEKSKGFLYKSVLK